MTDYLKARLPEILSQLLKENGYVTLQVLADKLGVSKRTVQHDVERVECLLGEMGLADRVSLSKKQGSGLRLQLSGITAGELEQKLDDLKDRYPAYDNYERRLEIAKFLLFSHDDLTFQFLADQFYVSKSVVSKDLVWVSKWLMQYGLGVTKRQNCGVRICGSEQMRRTAMAGLIALTSNRFAGEQGPRVPVGDDIDVLRLDLERFYTGLNGNPRADVGEIAKIIRDAERKYGFYLMDSYYTSLLVHLSIAVERLSSGQGTVDREAYPESILEYKEGKIANYIAQRMESTFRIRIPDSERSYICIHLMGAELPDPAQQDEMHSSRINTFTTRFVSFVEQMTGISFLQDDILLTALATHIKTSVFRIQSGMARPIHYAAHIPPELEPLYRAVWAGGYYYKQFFRVELMREERFSVYLHFAHSIRRRARRCRAIFLYQCDIIQAEETYRRLSTVCDELEVCDARDWSQRPDAETDAYDMVISAGGRIPAYLPVVQISTPVTQGELGRIRLDACAVCQRVFETKSHLPEQEAHVDWTTPVHTGLEGVLETLFDLMAQSGFSSTALSRESMELERDGRVLIVGDIALIPLYLPDVKEFQTYGFSLSAPIAVAGGRAQRVLFILLNEPQREGRWPDGSYPVLIHSLLRLAESAYRAEGDGG